MIEIKNLVKAYGDLPVLTDVSLRIPPGMIYGIIGRSGAGKSTLLRCINGLESFQSGSVVVDGVNVQQLSDLALRKFRKEVGMIFQQFSLLSRLTVYENVALPLTCWQYDKEFIDTKVKSLLAMVGIADKAACLPRELSGGQKQRVAIARALTMDPKILLCDEATSALDPKTATAIINLLKKINNDMGITIVMVTHQMSVLRAACEEILILEDGKVGEQGAMEQLFLEQPPALKRLLGEADLMIPETGTTLKVMLSREYADVPIITQMARDLATDFIILGGERERYRQHVLGSVIITMKNEDANKVQQYLTSRQVIWTILPGSEGGDGDAD